VSRSFSERQRQYQQRSTPQTCWRKCYPHIQSALTLLSHSRCRVIAELGCHNGNLAAACLLNLPEYWIWHGYDIVEPQHMREHPRFVFHHLTSQIWDADIVEFDVFVSSHTIEHLYADEVEQLIHWLSGRCRHVVLCVPLRRGVGDLKGWHVLKPGYEWLTRLMVESGFHPIWTCGGWFGWFQH